MEPYRQLVERSPNGIVISRNDRIVFANPAALQLADAASAGEILGTPLRDLFDAGSHAALDSLIAA